MTPNRQYLSHNSQVRIYFCTNSKTLGYKSAIFGITNSIIPSIVCGFLGNSILYLYHDTIYHGHLISLLFHSIIQVTLSLANHFHLAIKTHLQLFFLLNLESSVFVNSYDFNRSALYVWHARELPEKTPKIFGFARVFKEFTYSLSMHVDKFVWQ